MTSLSLLTAAMLALLSYCLALALYRPWRWW